MKETVYIECVLCHQTIEGVPLFEHHVESHHPEELRDLILEFGLVSFDFESTRDETPRRYPNASASLQG